MLLELNVKDIALIKKAHVEFGAGLNILTGETGAGKSVIIDSAMLAMGSRPRGDIVRRGADSGYVELIFDAGDKAGQEVLEELGIEPDDNGCIIISRRITHSRSVSRINDETVTLARLRTAASGLMDICGQNEFHMLTDSKKHLGILDRYLGDDAAAEKEAVRTAYSAYISCRKHFESFSLDDAGRNRKKELLSYQAEEIQRAGLKEGEEEELSESFRRLSNAHNILEHISAAHRELEDFRIDRALGSVESAMRYDSTLGDIYSELADAQSILDAAMRDLSSYAGSLDVDERELSAMEKRLDLIRSLESKYGGSTEEVLAYLSGILEELAAMDTYEEDRASAESALSAAWTELENACAALSFKRRSGAERLGALITAELKDLGFDQAELRVLLSDREPSAEGSDEACFAASLNPGEDLKPISEAASGGELSRIMLAVRVVLARSDETPTMIFDEIDTGISGRTAQKVAEKLDVLAMGHQVICVSHLPQIAAFADTHFLISKEESGGRNVTSIEKLDDEGSAGELARLLGGAGITKAVMDNAHEMKALAGSGKKSRRKQDI